MLTMQHHDAVYSPTLEQQGIQPGKKDAQQKAVLNQAQHLAYLEQHPYADLSEQEMRQVLQCCITRDQEPPGMVAIVQRNL